MKYKITYQQNSKIITDIIDTDGSNLDKKLQQFQNIIKIKSLEDKKRKNYFQNKKQEIYLFFKQLHLMLESHLNFHEALDLILQTNKNKYIQNIINIIQKSTTQNYPIEIALHEYTKDIGILPIAFLKQGIENGTIKDSIASIVLLLQKEITIKKNLLQTVRYPTLLLFSLVISLLMIFIYVVPNFEFIFQSLGDNLPFATELLLGVNTLTQNYWYLGIFLFIVIFFIFIFLKYRYKIYFDRLSVRAFPIVSKVILEYQLYKLFLALYIVVHSKYKFQTAVTNSIQTITNLYLKNIIEQIAQRIKNGEEIADAFSKYKLFDQMVIKLLYTAQSTSNYETVLLDITNYYQESFEQRLEKLGDVIEPFIIFIIAIVVLWLILAIMVPIWQMGAVGL